MQIEYIVQKNLIYLNVKLIVSVSVYDFIGKKSTSSARRVIFEDSCVPWAMAPAAPKVALPTDKEHSGEAGGQAAWVPPLHDEKRRQWPSAWALAMAVDAPAARPAMGAGGRGFAAALAGNARRPQLDHALAPRGPWGCGVGDGRGSSHRPVGRAPRS